MSKEKNEPIFIVHENLEEIDLYKDFFLVVKACRESCNFLKSIKAIYDHHIALQEDFDSELIKQKQKDIDQAIKEFYLLDKSLKTVNITDGQVVPLGEGHGVKDLLNWVKNHIKLRVVMDSLQLEVLNYLIETSDKMIRKVVESEPLMEQHVAQYHVEGLLKSAFRHSVDEDKLITYKLLTKQFKAELKKEGASLPEYLQVRDYTFSLNKARESFQFTQSSLVRLLELVPIVKEEHSLKSLQIDQFELNKKVARLNRIVMILTIVTVLIGLIGSVTGIITTYYAIKDHAKTDIQSIPQAMYNRPN